MYSKDASSNIKTMTNEIKTFYEEYQFPGNRPLDRDGIIFLKSFNKSIERLKKNKSRLTVLDAGCGTGNTTVALAKYYKNVKFKGLDNSKASLLKAEKSAQTNHLSNVNFKKWNLIKPLPYKKSFDVIYCLGVLHDTADMAIVLTNLQHSLKDKGELYLWIYAKHGRYYHTQNVKLLGMLLAAGENASEKDCIAKEFIGTVKNNIILKELLGKNIEDEKLQ